MDSQFLEFCAIDHSDFELSRIAKLLNLVFPKASHLTVDYLKWQYHDNPAGKVVGYNAKTKEGQIVAHYAVIPVEFEANGVRHLGGLSLNTAVHSDFQGIGLFTSLANMTYEACEKLGYSFVFGVANQNSTYGFVNKLGFKLLGPLTASVVIGQRSSHLESGGLNCVPTRGIDFLRWRMRRPGATYYLEEQKLGVDSRVLAWGPPGVFWNIDSVCADFGDILLRESLVMRFPKIWRAFPRIIIGRGAIVKSGVLSIPIPDFLKPSPLNLILKPLNASIAISDINDFSVMDFDVL